MKKYLFKPISACLISIVLLTACNKEGVETNDADRIPGTATLLSEEDPSGTGSVTGAILPPEANPIVYMIGNATIKIPVNADGTIASNSVPKGDYTVQIHTENSAYGDAMINDIRVEPGKTTDLGTIVLVKQGG